MRKEEIIKVPGFVGICASCFWPITEGKDARLNEEGLDFHKKCIERDKEGYYVRLEEFKMRYKAASIDELPIIIAEMKQVYSIARLDDDEFNKKNPEVIRLFKDISNGVTK